VRVPFFLIRAIRAIRGFSSSFFTRAKGKESESADGTDDAVASKSPESAWCVAANVVAERGHGPGGAERRRGTKHFAPGAKVYVYTFFWGMGGERVTVIGRHRKSRRFIRLTMPARHLANWRAELVYSPYVIRQISASGEFAKYPAGSDDARRAAEKIVAGYLRLGAASQPYTTRAPSASEPVSCPSPAMPTTDWPFDQPRNCAVLTLRSIVFGGAPILHVFHDADDHGWQFLGREDADEADAAVVALAEIVERDPSVLDVADLPPGWHAWRASRDAPWQRSERTADTV
jgi:hypothetical protein